MIATNGFLRLSKTLLMLPDQRQPVQAATKPDRKSLVGARARNWALNKTFIIFARSFFDAVEFTLTRN